MLAGKAVLEEQFTVAETPSRYEKNEIELIRIGINCFSWFSYSVARPPPIFLCSTISSYTLEFTMAKKGTKAKGPKGKKARAKAKLERQWGEVEFGGRKKRAGKSRLLTRIDDASKTVDQNSAPMRDGHEEIEDDQIVQVDEMSDAEEEACRKLLQSLQSQTNDESSVTSSNEDSDEDSTMDLEPAAAQTNLASKKLLQLDTFSDRFATSSLARDTTKRNNKEENVHTSTASFGCGKGTVLQINKSLVDLLELGSDGDMNAQCRACSNALVQSSVRKVLQDRFTNLSSQQNLLFPFLSVYADMLITSPIYSRDDRIYALHILNHIITSRGRVQRHNRRLQTLVEDADETEKDTWRRDQGYTRPTVLVLLPTKGCGYSFIKLLQSLLGDSTESERFESEFGPPSLEGFDLSDPVEQHRRQAQKKKGKEWLELFGDESNDDDDFKIGLSLQENKQRKRNGDDNSWNLKLFSDFYRSDIILASPLALKMNANNKLDDDRGFLFLSSIEICLVLRGDVLLMQNWDHMNDLLPELNQQPQNTTNIDFSRVRNYFLDGQAAYWRQLIITSSFLDPVMASTFKRHAKSFSGLVRVRQTISYDMSSMAKVILPTQQIFQRIATASFMKQSEDRLKYFFDKILPPVLRNKQKHTMVFIPSYFDFVSVRNRLLKEEASFVMVTEYSRITETSRARARFLQGRKPIMLYTGRAHFFHRHFIKGVRHLIFLGLPEYPEFYSQMVNMLNDGLESIDEANASCLALFTKYDKLALERIVGQSNSHNMVNGEKSTFIFS